MSSRTPDLAIAAPEFPQVSEELYLALLHSLTEGMCLIDRKGVIRFWNRAAEELSGYTPSEALAARRLDDVLSYCDQAGQLVPALALETLVDGHERTGRLFLRHKEGHRLPVRTRSITVRSSTGELLGAMDLFEIVDRLTPRQTAPDCLPEQPGDCDVVETPEFLAAHLKQRLEQVRHPGRPSGVLLIDVDRLADQAQRFGREAGDRLLSTVIRTTAMCLRDEDVCGYWNDDAILVVLYVANEDALCQVAERLRALIQASAIRWWGESLSVTVTIGATMLNADDSITSVANRVEASAAEGVAAGGDRVVLS
jgi:diguanylate cyclase (GGDEF)-like protein/PAS domain S-box-containing protein